MKMIRFAEMASSIFLEDLAKNVAIQIQVIDRLCLIVFSIFTAAATVGVLLAAPHVIVY